MIVLEDGKEIGLEEASSGLQSVVPLYVYVYYLTIGYMIIRKIFL